MKKTRMQKGITLIALIITIIILLILAVVTIGSIKNSNIITYAQNASKDYNDKKVEEGSKISGYETLIESNLPNGSKVTYKEGVPIPEGFYYVTGMKDTGLVISDSKLDENDEDGKDGNQFVWIPITKDIAAYGLKTDGYREPDVVTGVTPSETVDSASGNQYDGIKSNLERADVTEDLVNDGKIDAYDFKKQLEDEFYLMAASVNKYRGFYVGRYETSRNGKNPQSKYGEISAYDENEENDWYGLYALNRRYKTNYVQGSMMWGSQYEAMNIWMQKIDEENPIKEGYNKDRTCGTALKDVINNVYDLYGNSSEWTLEAYYPIRRVFRGGNYRASGKLGGRGSYVPTDADLSGFYASRLALYIL